MLNNVFEPLFEVTRNPESDPRLYHVLFSISGFDSVDEESTQPESYAYLSSLPPPHLWTSNASPPYGYYMYYMWANIVSLNKYRESKGLNTFTFRPHCGATGDRSHLSSAFLLANGISHGLLLCKSPALHYLYYLEQIGIYMSPLSEDALFVRSENNPFNIYFRVS